MTCFIILSYYHTTMLPRFQRFFDVLSIPSRTSPFLSPVLCLTGIRPLSRPAWRGVDSDKNGSHLPSEFSAMAMQEGFAPSGGGNKGGGGEGGAARYRAG